ncbi:Dlt1p Ecym_6079 [Eremothecium cymbalariae DBVPG|uniref:Defect at low temperature protein 1 n=1 Tax=Eremothecium cymbalariae (strain CBS 270.75 / DBVPG 7215 / KCTC 17166 / NRRL Y-17582) TaxID=931890 RepID=G8JUZ7_ERECY|nr:hypothetical protein Ecym_6079 [Eremothecium cymbalariae DBVPG\
MAVYSAPRWLHRTSLTIFCSLLVAFSLVMPIDSVVQAARSGKNALNTSVVVGAVVLTGIVFAVFATSRVLVHRSCIQDIPKRYIPITKHDILHSACRDEITKCIEFTHKSGKDLRTPMRKVVHDGLEPPPNPKFPGDDTIPPLLNYKTCLKVVADRFKFQGMFLNNLDANPRIGSTFSQYVREQFKSEDEALTRRVDEFIDLYEKIRYSDTPIRREEFLRYMDISLYFVDLSLIIGHEHPVNINELAYPASSKRTSVASSSKPGTISGECSDYNGSGDLIQNRNWTALQRTGSTGTVAIRIVSTQPPEEPEFYRNELQDASVSYIKGEHTPSSAGSYNSVIRR